MNVIAISIVMLALAAEAPDEMARYRDIYTHSMFARNRRPDAPPARDAPPELVETEPEQPVDPASHFLLVGVSLIGDQRIAFFADQRDGVVRPYDVGQTLADRELIAITLEGVVVRLDESEHEIPVGRLLVGEAPPTSVSTPDIAPTPQQNDEGSSVLERLRRQREEELGQ